MLEKARVGDANQRNCCFFDDKIKVFSKRATSDSMTQSSIEGIEGPRKHYRVGADINLPALNSTRFARSAKATL